ncbi:uncharacterized protein LOC120255331 isoform X1 [Dioscorea cayenensis subsp. rotundata]|uniref:Uncharacterized protein LOC120255331 isoform X1 n=1 Tax=Dioscorea cayennensis subsp. rotundata TaxID=55577 RepID=A0AB40AW00_DIOCR|nr:uncharacterized protein LOC120255331 isoform X1 [Dioscorea cayenensis subsp. rotundata]
MLAISTPSASSMRSSTPPFCLQQASIITGCGEKQSDELAKVSPDLVTTLEENSCRFHQKCVVIFKDYERLIIRARSASHLRDCQRDNRYGSAPITAAYKPLRKILLPYDSGGVELLFLPLGPTLSKTCLSRIYQLKEDMTQNLILT